MEVAGGSIDAPPRAGPCAFAKKDPNKVIAALVLATLVTSGRSSRVALRGYTDNKSNDSLLRKAMTTKSPSTLDDDLTNEKFASSSG